MASSDPYALTVAIERAHPDRPNRTGQTVAMTSADKPTKIGLSHPGTTESADMTGQQQATSPTNQSLLSRLPEHLVTSLFRRATMVRLETDEVLFLAGDIGDGCYRVNDGLLKVTMVSRAGNERILAFLGPGAIVGEMSIIDRLPRSANVVAVRPAVLSFISSADFVDFAKKHPQVYECLVTLLAARLRETDTTIAAGTFLPLRGRVACALLELAQEFGQDVGPGRVVIHQKIGQSDLAAMAGIARESLNRILNDWKRRKLVTQLSGYYCIEDKAQLQNEAEL
jgi:CRP/FNR family transcriptional regulator, cyclic AMP receptor protein